MFDNSFNNQNVDTSPTSRAILVPFREFTADSPPPYQGVNGIPVALKNALPVIAATAINQLTRVAASTPVFCFLYNRVMLNNMRNPEWQKIFEAIVFHTWYNIKSNRYPEEMASLNDAAKSVIMVYGSYVAVQTNEMQFLLTQQQKNEVKDLATRWAMFAKEYENLLSTSQQQQMGGASTSAFSSGQSISAAWASPNQRQAGTGVGGLADMAPVATYIAPGQDMMSLQPTNNDGYYDEPATPTYRPVQREMYIPGINDTDAKPPEQPKMPPKASFLSHVTEIARGSITRHDRSTDPIVFVTADKWTPTPFQPYHPAYRFGDEAVYEATRDTNGMERIIAIINHKETEMDQSKHNFTSNASFFSSMGGGAANPELSISYALSETAKAILSGDVGENEEATQLYKRLGVIDNEPVDVPGQTSLAALITEARAYQMASGSREMSFLVASSISAQLVSYTAHPDIVANLRRSTLEAGAQYLRNLMQEIKNDPTEANVGKLQFILAIDRLIKRELLSVIRFRMGIGPDFNFDSFMDDEPDIRTALQTVHGVSHTKSYIKVQSEMMPAMFDEALVDETPLTNGQDDTPVGYITSVSPLVTVLLLNISNEQLGLQLPDGAVCEVFEDTFPGLYMFIKSVIQTNQGVLHHYIVTNDDVAYEVNVGLVGTDHMVLTRVPVGI